LKSYGCSSNTADAEFIAGCLAEAGFELVNSIEQADVLIYNTCAVKTPTENRAIEVLKRAGQMKDKRLLVTGCLPLINFCRLKDEVRFDAVLGPSSGSRIVEAVQKVINNEAQVLIKPDSDSKPDLFLPRRATNPVISIIPLAQGCLGSCSYCCVVKARGHLRSHSIHDVVKRVQADLNSGAREVWLTGQDTASYGRDMGFNLADLLTEVCSLEGEYLVRVGMMTPNLTLDVLPDLVKAFQNEHVFKFVHLPIQSGDDQVLKRMNRHYSVDDFSLVVETFREAIPDLTLATDVICGFPDESEEAFSRTLRLIKEIKPDIVNVSKFFPRPGTVAQKMTPKVSQSDVKLRSARIASLAKRISCEKNKTWLDWRGTVLIDERGKQPDSFIGRNYAYKPIVVKSQDRSQLGRFVEARVTKAFQTYLEAEIG